MAEPKPSNPEQQAASRRSKKKKSTSKQESFLQRSTSLIIAIIAILIAFGGGRYVRTSIHGWVDQKMRDLLPWLENQTPRIWTITPDSTGLKVDASIYQEYLGSQRTMLEKRPRVRAGGGVYVM